MKKIYEQWIVMVHRNDGLYFEKLELIGEVECTEKEANAINEISHQNGIRYYERQEQTK